MIDPVIIDWLASCTKDPLRFVMEGFPWGQPGSRLENAKGPEPWQRDILLAVASGLLSIGEAIQLSTASGHGVGKSALVAWLIIWAMSTAENTRGVVTANTETQLKTKTWVELGKWFHMFIGKELFTLTATQLFAKSAERDWRFDMVPWSERNTEAFAGLHNQGRRILVIFDEASAIPDIIWETTEGALTDANTEILWLVFGNPTRNSGRFRDCFPGQRFASLWKARQVDSREVSITNKDQIKKWITAYGDDSDFVRIRVKGQFPRQGEMEFFNAGEVDEAMVRDVETSPTDPLALGVDVARFGKNNSVLWTRKGRDARSVPRQAFNGMDTVSLATKVYEIATSMRPDGIFIDGGGVGGGVVDNCRHRNLFVYDIQFGGKSSHIGFITGTDGEKYANKRAEMYGALRSWLKGGAIPNDPDIRKQLMSITYTFNLRDEIILTSKEVMMRDGFDSPDDIDALALTFALPLASKSWDDAMGEDNLVQSEYDPFQRYHEEVHG